MGMDPKIAIFVKIIPKRNNFVDFYWKNMYIIPKRYITPLI